MTIDKQKLLSWINDKKYVYSVGQEYLDREEIDMCKGAVKVLNMINYYIELGEFETDDPDVWKRSQKVLGSREE